MLSTTHSNFTIPRRYQIPAALTLRGIVAPKSIHTFDLFAVGRCVLLGFLSLTLYGHPRVRIRGTSMHDEQYAANRVL